MPPSVSVVIATYNGAHFIEQALDSVFVQTLLPDEIVVVDDCSTDETRRLVQSIKQRAPLLIKTINLEKNSGGPAKPLNTGLGSARGNILLLLDQDDLMRPNRVELQANAVTEFPQCSISIGRFSIIGRDENDVSPIWPVAQFYDLAEYLSDDQTYSIIESEVAFKPLLHRNYALSVSNFCFTREWWTRIGAFDERISTCIDLDYMLRATAAGPIVILAERLFDYRCGTTGLQRRNPTRSALESIMVRLRAASEKPEWAADEVIALRYSALMAGNAAIRKGDLRALRAIAETFSKYKGLTTVQRSLKNKAKRILRFSGGDRG